MTLAHIKSAALAALFLFVPSLAQADALSPADKDALAGEWRTQCGAMAADGTGLRMVIEFAVTGGNITLDDGTEGGGEYVVKGGSVRGDRIKLELEDQGTYEFVRQGKLLKGVAGDVAGNSFTRCREPADRKAIRLDSKALHYLSATLGPDRAIFVDTRAKAGCKAIEYQYLTIDLVGPSGFSLGRWNSYALGEKIASGKKPPFDEVSNFTIDKAETMGGNYRLTVTELIPPNGSRGDTTTLTLMPAATGVVTLPEWKRSYRRCTQKQLSAE